MDPLILLQMVAGLARALMNKDEPTPEQIAALEQSEELIDAKLTADLQKVAGLPTAAQQI